MNAFSRRSIRLVWKPEVTEPRFYGLRFFTVVALAACGIVLLSWPFVEPQKDEIDSWIEQHRSLVGAGCLWMIAVIAGAVKRIAERNERIYEVPRLGYSSTLPHAGVRRLARIGAETSPGGDDLLT